MSVLRRRLYDNMDINPEDLPWIEITDSMSIRDTISMIARIWNLETGEECSTIGSTFHLIADTYPARFVIEFNPGINSVTGLFLGKSELVAVSHNLLRRVANTVYWVNELFQDSGLKYIPEDLFKGCYRINDFRYCFFNCVNISGRTPLVDGKELWAAFPKAKGSDCYFNCTGLENYDIIPTDWK